MQFDNCYSFKKSLYNYIFKLLWLMDFRVVELFYAIAALGLVFAGSRKPLNDIVLIHSDPENAPRQVER